MATTVTQPQTCPRNDLRTELNALANRNLQRYQGREDEGPILLEGKDLYWRFPDYNRSRIPRHVFDALVEHEKRFGRLSRLTEDDREISGADLLDDNRWPFCRECLSPFENLLNGHAGQGCWVSRIEDGADICGPCWLGETYGWDASKMIEHVIRHDLGDALLREAARYPLRRGHGETAAADSIMCSYWRSPGLFELLRLHRVSVETSATVIFRLAKALLAAMHADEKAALAARKALWRDERRALNLKLVRAA